MSTSDGYHHRGYLPHFSVVGATYFLTLRLADSLPRDLVLRLKDQRDDLLRRSKADSAAQREVAVRESFAQYAAEVDATLDRNIGVAWLRNPQIAALVAKALKHLHGQHDQLSAWCVMPNHVHAVVCPLGNVPLEQILQNWKSYTAHAANRLLRRSGAFWPRESYDHWIRDESEFAHFVRYTEDNPVKAGLCMTSVNWPWSSANQSV